MHFLRNPHLCQKHLKTNISEAKSNLYSILKISLPNNFLKSVSLCIQKCILYVIIAGATDYKHEIDVTQLDLIDQQYCLAMGESGNGRIFAYLVLLDLAPFSIQ